MTVVFQADQGFVGGPDNAALIMRLYVVFTTNIIYYSQAQVHSISVMNNQPQGI